jgi:glycosyltransferase involved in cell wall biosynthesis
VIQIVSNLFPRIGFPSAGIFIKDHAEILHSIQPTEVLVLKTYFPKINSDWKLYGAEPIQSNVPVQTIPFYTIPKFKTPRISSHKLISDYHNRFRQHKPNLVILHFLYPSILLTPYLIKENVPYILHIHGSDVDIVTSDKRLIDITRNALVTAKFIFYSGLESLYRLERVMSVPKNKCVFIPNPIIVIDKSISSNEVNLRLPFRKNIATVANIVEHKGVNTILKLANKFPEFAFHIIGHIPSDSFAQEFIKESFSLNNLFIHQPMNRTQLHSFLSNMDAYIHPSTKESFGMAVCEAILLGLPILARKIGVLQNLDPSNQVFFYEEHNLLDYFNKIVYINKVENSISMEYISNNFGVKNIEMIYRNLLK